jgi:hypothetical protein
MVIAWPEFGGLVAAAMDLRYGPRLVIARPWMAIVRWHSDVGNALGKKNKYLFGTELPLEKISCAWRCRIEIEA